MNHLDLVLSAVHAIIWCMASLCVSAQPDASSMPRLPAGQNHLGILVGFDSYSIEEQNELDARLEELYQAGMSTGRIQLDWKDLEPEPGKFDAAPLQDALDLFQRNETIFLLISSVDSEGPAGTRPPDLEDTPFADETLWPRFAAMLDDVVIPVLSASPQIYLLSVGNEPGGYLEEEPSELIPLANFVSTAAEYVRDAVPDVAVGLTMDVIIKEIADASDVVIFNQYGLNADLTAVTGPQDFLDELMARRVIFGMDRPFVIQELGMPSGWEDGRPSTINTSPDFADQIATVMLQELRENHLWRAAYWFTAVDWSLELINLYLSAIGSDDLDQTIVDRIDEWLRTGGLLRYDQANFSNFTPRPVWNAFLDGMRDLYSSPSQPSTAPSKKPSLLC